MISKRVRRQRRRVTPATEEYTLNGSHQAVAHSVGEYVREKAHTNGIESFWSLLKRGYVGIYHQMSIKHIHRYVNEFSSRHTSRNNDTLGCITTIIDGMIGQRLSYKELTS